MPALRSQPRNRLVNWRVVDSDTAGQIDMAMPGCRVVENNRPIFRFTRLLRPEYEPNLQGNSWFPSRPLSRKSDAKRVENGAVDW